MKQESKISVQIHETEIKLGGSLVDEDCFLLIAALFLIARLSISDFEQHCDRVSHLQPPPEVQGTAVDH